MRTQLLTSGLALAAGLVVGCSPEREEVPRGIEAEAYAILNDIIEDNALLAITTLCEEPIRLDVDNERWSEEFTAEDIEFVRQCQDSLASRLFVPGRITSWVPRKRDWMPATVVHEDDSTFYDEMSWPLFDLKREKALVSFVSNANGMLSGSGRTVLFVKVRGRWKQWKVYGSWIS